MYFWITFFLWNFITYITLFLFSLVLEPRGEKFPRMFWVCLFTTLTVPLSYIQMLHTVSQDFWYSFSMYTSMLFFFLFFIIPFKNKLWQKILLFLMYNIISMISAQIQNAIMLKKEILYDFTYTSFESIVMEATFLLIMILLVFVFILVWNSVVNKKTNIKTPWLFLIFPISQYFILWNLDDISIMKQFGIQSNLGIILGFIADAILLYVLVEQSNKEEMEKQLQEFQYKQQMEIMHYQAIETRRTEIAKMRHDFNNQLTTAYHLIDHGQTDRSREILDKLKESVAKTSEDTYCANSVINAVLSEKEMICLEQNIRFETDLILGEELQIQPIHMCSIFSNLLDNAIKATGKCTEEKRFINIKAKRIEDYIHIKVENASLEPTKLKPDLRKHYGHEILRDIAQQYNGEFHTEWKDGVYCARLSLTIES